MDPEIPQESPTTTQVVFISSLHFVFWTCHGLPRHAELLSQGNQRRKVELTGTGNILKVEGVFECEFPVRIWLVPPCRFPMSMISRRKRELIIGPGSGVNIARENVHSWQRLQMLNWDDVHRIREIAVNIVKSRPQDDVVVIVMGACASGKTSFIKTFTGDGDVGRKTSKVACHEYFLPDGRKVRLIDTPGFDQRRDDITDIDILKMMGEFLVGEYREGRKLNGAIYMHDIAQHKYNRSGTHNIRLFRKLVGEACFSNVVIVTTMWDTIVEAAVGQSREEELSSTPLAPLIDAGGRVIRHRHISGVESAQKIIDMILGQVPKALLIQEELIRPGTRLADTSAGVELSQAFAYLEKEERNKLKKLRPRAPRLTVGKHARYERNQIKNEFNREKKRLRKQLERWKVNQEALQSHLSGP